MNSAQFFPKPYLSSAILFLTPQRAAEVRRAHDPDRIASAAPRTQLVGAKFYPTLHPHPKPGTQAGADRGGGSRLSCAESQDFSAARAWRRRTTRRPFAGWRGSSVIGGPMTRACGSAEAQGSRTVAWR